MNEQNRAPLRLGFAVKVLGAPKLKSNDSRRWNNNPHLRVSLQYLHKIFDYLGQQQIGMYRFSSELAPYVTHPGLPRFHGMIRECRKELAAIGARARAMNLRLSFHPSQYIVLNSLDPKIVRSSILDIEAQAQMLDLMELGPEAVVVIHVGGAYGDRASGNQRWVETWNQLSESARRRLVLEHDDQRFSPADILWIHQQTGVRLIFDYQHFWCFNPERLQLKPTLKRILATWPAGVRPKIHFSSPVTELREVERKDRKSGKKETVRLMPVWTGHADFINPFEFSTFFRSVPDWEFDVMLEAKAKDLALTRLRSDMARYAPELAPRFGVIPETGKAPEAQAATLPQPKTS